MKLIQCRIENFGKLCNFDYHFVDGLNNIKATNGWGKSTLATFIKAMFYGLPATTKRNLDENERKKYLPWQGGNYGGNLVFAMRGKQYKIERFFGKNNAEDTFALFDLATGKKTTDFSSNLGEEIFGLDEAAFERSAYLPQKVLNSNINESITQKLNHLIQGTTEDFNFESAQERLDRQRAALFNNKKTGQVQILEARIEDLTSQMRELSACGLAVDAIQKQVAIKDMTITTLGQEQAALQQQRTQQELLAKFNQSTPSHRPQWQLRLALLVLGLLGIVGGISLLPLQRVVAVILLVVGIGLFLVGIMRVKMRTAPATDAFKELAPANLDVNQLQQMEKTMQSEIDRERDEKARLLVRIEQIQDNLAGLSDLENEKANLQNDLQTLQQTLSAVKHAMQFLQAANESLSAKFLSPMKNGLNQYLTMLNDQAFTNLNLDTDFNITFEEYGKLREVDYYSKGYQNMLDLCLRFALIDALYDQEKPFIVLDDPLINMDDVKVAKAKRLLQDLAQQYQLIYFSCHQSRC